MTVVSQLIIKVKPGKRDAAINAYRERHVLKECEETIPGYISGRLLAATDCPDTLLVDCEWDNEQSIKDWLAHPVRDAQSKDLADYLAEMPTSRLYLREE